jgi:glutamine synthetase
MTEVMHADGTPHSSNGRATIDDDGDFWFGFEQEYFIMDTKTLPLGFLLRLSCSQGMYYCSVGGKNTHGRALVEEHDLCIAAGINFEGINQEVACGQWDFNCLHKEQKKLVTKWVARYLLDRLTEKYGYYIEYHPKPLGDTD